MSDRMLQALEEAVGRDRVQTDHQTVAFLARDALHPARTPADIEASFPRCVVQPRSPHEVAAVVRVANQYHTPVIPLGGGSGLMGGAAAFVAGIAVDLRALKAVRVRPQDRMADAGAGVTMRELNEAAAPHGLMCGHDPWTVAVATVGGTIGTNSLGYLGGKYGAMGDQVLGLEVVLPTGEILRTRGVEKTSTGPALHHLFIGAEGCFGIVTQATLRLVPIPAARLLQGWEFADFAAGFAAVQALLSTGVRPGLLDFGDDDPILAPEPVATLWVGYEGPRRVAAAEAQEGAEICELHQGRRLPEREVRDFWDQRHTMGDAYAMARLAGRSWHRHRPTLDYLHVALPPSAVLTYRRQCLERLERRGLKAHQSGIWDHAGLFSLVYSGGDMPLLTEVHSELLRLCQDLEGSMEYCHGVGVRLASLMAREHGPGLEVMQRLKRCLDPQGLLNPGKLGLDG